MFSSKCEDCNIFRVHKEDVKTLTEKCSNCKVVKYPVYKTYCEAPIGARFRNPRNGEVWMKVPDIGFHHEDLVVNLESGRIFGIELFFKEPLERIK